MDELAVVDGAVEDDINALTGDGDVHTVADTVGTSGPASVDEEGVGTVLLHLLTEELGVDDGVQGKEGTTVAGGEGGLGLLDASLSTGDLSGVAGEVVVHGLTGSELGDGRKNTVSIAGEEDDVLRVASAGGRLVVGDVVERVGDTTVLSLGLVVEVDGAVLSHPDVLEKGVSLDGAVDLGLLLSGEIDGLGVAAALEVEDAVVIPTVLIITEKPSLGVGGKGGLTGTGETEEEGGVAVLAAVGGAVHGEDALEREPVVHEGEDTLLHLTTVGGADDDGDLLLEVEADEGLGVQALGLPVLVDEALGGVDDGEVGDEVLDLLLGLGDDEHVLDEVVLPGPLGDETDLLEGGLGGAAVGIEDVDLLAVHVGLDVAVELVEDLRADGLVGGDLAPPDVVLGGLLLDEVLILGGTAGVFAGIDGVAAEGGHLALLVLDLVLEDLLVAEIVVDLAEVHAEGLVDAEGGTSGLDVTDEK